MRLNIAWAYDGYKVSVPNWDGGEVVTADEADRWREALEEIAAGTMRPSHFVAQQALGMNQDHAEEG